MTNWLHDRSVLTDPFFSLSLCLCVSVAFSQGGPS
jgi:hypothetical protein